MAALHTELAQRHSQVVALVARAGDGVARSHSELVIASAGSGVGSGSAGGGPAVAAAAALDRAATELKALRTSLGASGMGAGASDAAPHLARHLAAGAFTRPVLNST